MRELNEPEYFEKEYNNKIIREKRCAEIQLIGEKKPRKISWGAYIAIKSLPASFTGSIEIRELGISVARNQIVKMEEKKETETTYKEFTLLPTDTLLLDEDKKVIRDSKLNVERTHNVYYTATCHYYEENGERKYLLDDAKIKKLLKMKKIEDGYPFSIVESKTYGLKDE